MCSKEEKLEERWSWILEEKGFCQIIHEKLQDEKSFCFARSFWFQPLLMTLTVSYVAHCYLNIPICFPPLETLRDQRKFYLNILMLHLIIRFFYFKQVWSVRGRNIFWRIEMKMKVEWLELLEIPLYSIFDWFIKF